MLSRLNVKMILRRGGGIGRRAGFRSQWQQCYKSSTLFRGTDSIKYQVFSIKYLVLSA